MASQSAITKVAVRPLRYADTLASYDSLSLAYEDLGRDVGQTFVVDGDSLLLDAFCDPLLDWSRGGQFLHLTFIIESFLERLGRKDRTFEIVFFSTFADRWTDVSKAAAREAIIRHLTVAQFRVRTFVGWWTADFSRYLGWLNPSFLLLADGSADTKFGVPDLTYPLRALALWALTRSLSCVRSTEVAVPGDRMRAFMLSMKADLRARLGQLAHPVFLPRTTTLPAIDTAVLERIHKSTSSYYAANHGAARMIVTLYALGMTLRDVAAPAPELEGLPSPKAEKKKAKNIDTPVEYWDLAKIVLVHTMLLDNLRLEARSHTELPADAQVTTFLNAFYRHAIAALRSSIVVSDGSIADLIDGRLLHHVMTLLSSSGISSLGFPQSMLTELQMNWEVVPSTAVGADKVASYPLFPILELATCGPYNEHADEAAAGVVAAAIKEYKSDVIKATAAQVAAREGPVGVAAAATSEIKQSGSSEGLAADTVIEWREKVEIRDGKKVVVRTKVIKKIVKKAAATGSTAAAATPSDAAPAKAAPAKVPAKAAAKKKVAESSSEDEDSSDDDKPAKKASPAKVAAKAKTAAPAKAPAKVAAKKKAAESSEEESSEEDSSDDDTPKKKVVAAKKVVAKKRDASPSPERSTLEFVPAPSTTDATAVPTGFYDHTAPPTRTDDEEPEPVGYAVAEGTSTGDVVAVEAASAAPALVDEPKKEEKGGKAAAKKDVSSGAAKKAANKAVAAAEAASAAAAAKAAAKSAAPRLEEKRVARTEGGGVGTLQIIKNELLPSIMGDLDDKLARRGIVYQHGERADALAATKAAIAAAKAKGEDYKEVKEAKVGEDRFWHLGRLLDDSMDRDSTDAFVANNPRYKFAADQHKADYMKKYSKSLTTNFKIVLRDIVNTQEEDAEEERKEAERKQSVAKKGGPPSPAANVAAVAAAADADDSDEDDAPAKKGAKAGKASAAKKEKKPKKEEKKGRAAEIMAETAAKQKEKFASDMLTIVSTVVRNNKTLDERIAALDDKLLDHRDQASALIGLRELLKWCVEAWKKNCIERKSTVQLDHRPAARLFQMVHDIYRRFKTMFIVADIRQLQDALLLLGFNDTAQEMLEWYVKQNNLDATAAAAAKVDPKDVSRDFIVGMDRARFQLSYCGHLMIRNVDSAPDERVSGYYPDRWQRELLDVVDRNESALVVAPTSSGKTMVSYYAMQQVHAYNKTVKSSERGIVVYVSPTKALVNQVAAEVYQRELGSYGVMTRDWHHNVMTCDILIIVPQCLEILLLSPQREDWVKRIRYAVFDECHLIGSAGGETWERLLTLLHCPFLALSATVGNPSQFHQWLQRMQSIHSRNVRFIAHHSRWSDLESYVYCPRTRMVQKAIEASEVTAGTTLREVDIAGEGKGDEKKAEPVTADGPKTMTLSLEEQAWQVPYTIDTTTREVLGGPQMTRFHPCAALFLDPEFRLTGEFPADLNFSPAEVLSLYDSLARIVTQSSSSIPAERRQAIRNLAPDSFFRRMYIPRKAVTTYEKAIKDECSNWIKAGLGKYLQSAYSSLCSDVMPALKESNKVRDSYFYSREFVRKHFLPLLLELNATDKLPVITFIFDRTLANTLCVDTLNILEAAEKAQWIKEGNKNAVVDRKKEREKDAAKKANKDKRDKKQSKEEAEASRYEETVTSFNEEGYRVDPRFSFTREGERLDAEERKFWVNRLIRKQKWDADHPLIRALYRGIGVHHGSLPKAYKDLVETLFRSKKLKVILASGTLALGVNMPARTTIFIHDSRFLEPIAFRQMAGRAGRRGYDNIGYIIFMGIPVRKVCRLLKAPLTQLKGHWPLTTTLSLRMMMMFARSKDQPFATRTLTNLLREPFLSQSLDATASERLTVQIRHHFRFVLDFLHRNQLINAIGDPTGFASLAAQLHFQESANFAFVTLLASGEIRRLCVRYKEAKRETVDALMEIIAMLFCRVPLPADTRLRASAVSKVTLDGPKDRVASHLQKMNENTLAVFTSYCRVFAAADKDASLPYARLPVSRIPFGGSLRAASTATSISPPGGVSATPSMVQSLHEHAIRSEARSQFVALSGHGDHFRSAEELAYSVRGCIRLEPELIPVCGLHDVRGRALQLNAYAWDFAKHGNLNHLLRDNKMKDGYVWHRLKECDLVMKTIVQALELLSVDAAEDPILMTFRDLRKDFLTKFDALETTIM